MNILGCVVCNYVCICMYVCMYGYGSGLMSMWTMAMSVADGTIDDHDNGSVNIYVSSCVCLSVCVCWDDAVLIWCTINSL